MSFNRLTKTLIIVVFASLAPSIVWADKKTDLAAYMDACADVNKFNGSVLVSQDDQIVFEKGYGMANFEHDVANAPYTKFRIGSITKQFTAMAIMILEEQGKLKTDDPVSKFISDSPEAWTDVTIHHLLNHTSGIPSFTSMFTYRRDMMLPQSVSQMMARFKGKKLNFQPGEKFQYSNSGYYLLGAIIEKASGKTYEEFLREEICKPLKLNDTGYERFIPILKHRASGYQRSGRGASHAPYLDMSQPYAAGSMYSTVRDLNLWDQALRQGKLISKERYERMYQPGKRNYAYGWNVGKKLNRRSISHGGGINGFQTEILRFPEEKLCVVVLCNITPSNPARVARDLAAIMLDEDYKIPQTWKTAKVSPELMKAHVGKYQLSPQLTITIRQTKDSLSAQMTGQPAGPLQPASPTVFFNKQVGAEFTFEQDESGKTTALVLRQRGNEIRAERIQAEKPESETDK